MVVAIIVLVAFIVYQVINTQMNPEGSSFSKTVPSISSSLGTGKLTSFNSLYVNMPVPDSALDNK